MVELRLVMCCAIGPYICNRKAVLTLWVKRELAECSLVVVGTE
jgi:hypothetical protein